MLLEKQTFDEAFVARLRQADPVAEQEFFAHFNAVIWIKLRSSVRSVELIEDIRQETLFRVLRYLRSDKPLQNPQRLGAFVYGVCRNVTREMQRSQRRHPQLLETAPDPVDPRSGTGEEIAAWEREQIIRELLEELSPRDREVLGAMYLEQVDRNEICRRTGMSESHFRVVLHRARLRFRDLVQRAKK